MSNPNERAFKPLKIAVMTVSDTRTETTDKSGDTLVKLLTGAGSSLTGRVLMLDALSMEWQFIRLQRDPACSVCGR